MARFVQCSARSCPGLERATWFLVATRFLEAVTQQHQQPRILLTQGLRRLPKSSFFSFQHCEGDSLHWSELWRGWRLWRQWFSHSGHWLTPACLPCPQYWWSIWTGLQHERHINWHRLARHGTSTSAYLASSMTPSCSMLWSFLLWTGTGQPDSWICNRIPGTGTDHTVSSSSSKTIFPTSRSEVSAKLKLSQLSTLWRRHSPLIWSLAKKTGSRMVLSQWLLADTCMCACALCSVLVIDVNWLPAWTPHELARVACNWTSTGACILLARQKLFNASAHSCSELERATWFLRILEAVTQQHQQPRILLTPGLRRLPKSSFLGFQHCKGDSLHWSELWRGWRLWRHWFSHSGHWLTPAKQNRIGFANLHLWRQLLSTWN